MSDLAPETCPIFLAGRGPELERAAATLGALPDARVLRVAPEALGAGLEPGSAGVLVLAGDVGALELCRCVRARWGALSLPILVLGAPVADALAAGANDGIAAPWEAGELAARAGGLLKARRLHARALVEAREETRQSEGAHELRNLADALPQMVWKADAAGEMIYVNHRWTEYTGLDLEQSANGRWLALVHPEERDASAALWLRCVHAGDDLEGCYRLRRRDGVHRWHLTRAHAQRDAAGCVLCWFGTSTDIEDQKRAAGALDILARAGATLATPLDAPARVAALLRLVVPELGDFCGVYLPGDRGEVMLVEAAAVDPEHVDIARTRIARQAVAGCGEHLVAQVVRTGQPLLYAEVTDADYRAMAIDAEDLAALRRKGTSSWLCVPMLVRGRILGAIALGLSRSPRRYGEADLLLAEELARRAALAIENAQLLDLAERERRRGEEANRLKDEFLANLNHELRTPLTAILGWARVLRTHTLPEDKRVRALEKIERNGQAQVRLIEDLLDASRILSGTLAIGIAPTDVAAVVHAALAAARPLCDAKGIALRAATDAAAGSIEADAERLQQVVEKLLSNAIKFTPAGGSIAICVDRLDRDGGYSQTAGPASVRISVSDTGEGIRADFLPHVFDRFRQADGSTTRAHGGLGLGLAIARRLVELHGGTVSVRSEGEGLGATFTVRLPVTMGGPRPPQTPLTLRPEGGPRPPQTPLTLRPEEGPRTAQPLHTLRADGGDAGPEH
jgi:PAS domain S-box-containing protein